MNSQYPHIQEALIGGLVASIPMWVGMLIGIGSLKRLFREYPPHRHINGLTIYPKGYEPGRTERMQAER